MKRLLLLLPLLVAAAVAAAASPAPPRSVGLIDGASRHSGVPFARLTDAIVAALVASQHWQPTVLTDASPLLRAAGLAWPAPPGGDWRQATAALQSLAAGAQLDDLLVLMPAAGRLEVLWVEPKQAAARQLQFAAPAPSNAAYSALAHQLVARLGEGFQAAPPLAGAAPAAPPSLAKPGNAAPVKPVSSPAPVTTPRPSAPHTSPPPAPAAPPRTAAATPRLSEPAAKPAQPASQPIPAAVPPAQPATPLPAPPAAKPAPPAKAAPPPSNKTSPASATMPPGNKTSPTNTVAPPPPTPPVSRFLVAAEKYLAEGNFDKAEDVAGQAIADGAPKDQVYYFYARLAAARQDPVEERKWLEQTLGVNPNLTAAHLQLAELLRGQGLWREAMDEYHAVLKARPEDLHASLGLAAIYADHDQPRRAAELLSGTAAKHPDNVALYLRLGDLYAQAQDLAEAEQAYDHAAKLSQGENRASALDRLGDLYAGAQRYHEAFICYAEASKLRGGGSSPLAEKRYSQVMSTADTSLTTALDQASKAMSGYLKQTGVYREDAYRALSALHAEVQDVTGFADSIVPPQTMKLTHAQRQLAYSLAGEVAIDGMTYLDTGMAQMLKDYNARLADTRQALAALQQPGK